MDKYKIYAYKEHLSVNGEGQEGKNQYSLDGAAQHLYLLTVLFVIIRQYL